MSTVQKPKLQQIRHNNEEAPDLEHFLTNLPRDKTCRIHAAYFFHPKWLNVLLKVIKMLNGPTKSWYEFGMFLDVDPYTLQALSYSHQSINSEDPAHNVILAFVQRDGATLDNVIDALKKVGRCDIIIVLVEDCNLPALVDQIINCDDGYHSGNFEGHSENLNYSILRPKIVLPHCPKLLQDVHSSSQNSTDHSCREESEQLQKNSAAGGSNQSEQEQEYEYGCTVMLTYTEDGNITAQKVAAELRRDRDGFPDIGVLILDEHMNKVNSNPGLFITSCFTQVDYVVPIITAGYIKKALSDKPVLASESSLSLDNKYVKLIYSMMDHYYVRNGCLNDKIRCLIPDDIVSQVMYHPFMEHPMFQVWNRVSETNQFCERILHRAISFKS